MVGDEHFISITCLRRVQKNKWSPFIQFAFRPHSPAVTGNDAFDNGEPDSGAFKLSYAMQTLEHAEQLVRKPHIEPDSVVPHVIDRFSLLDVSATAILGVALGWLNLIAFESKFMNT